MVEIITRPYLSGIPEYEEKLFGCSSPNYIQWSGDGGTITTGEITDGTNTFTGLYPNQAGIFSFDLSIFGREAIKKIIGDSREVAATAFLDQSLSKPVQVTVKVNYSDEDTEELQDNELYYINAYRQRKNIKKASFYEEGVSEVTTGTDDTQSRVLLPSNVCPVFAGYPNDVSIFHFEFTTGTDDFILYRASGVDIVGSTYLIAEDYQGVISVNLNDLTAFPSINIVTAESGGETRLNRQLALEHFDYCGLYLRWLNSYGGWSYWLFEGKQVEANAIDRGGVVQQFTANPFIEETFSELPKEQEQRVIVGTRLSESWQVLHLQDLELSNHVYLYTLDKNEVETGTDETAWQRVKVRAFNMTPKRQSNSKTLTVELSLGSQYTQQL